MATTNDNPRWILKPNKDYLNKESNNDCLNFLYQKGKFYVMDNHLAAGWCWLHSLNQNEEYGFIHIDQHDDLVNNKNIIPLRDELLKEGLSITEYTSFELDGEKVFTWDNYILHIHQILPKWFKPICISTHKTTRVNEIRFDLCPDILGLPLSINPFTHEAKLKCILNLDIDYFFNGDGIRILTDDYIRLLAKGIKRSLPNIAVVTIALSPEWCGGWSNAIEAVSILDDELSLGFVQQLKSIEHNNEH